MNTHSTPPRGLPQVILKEKEAYALWQKLHRDFPRVERLGIGQKIENIGGWKKGLEAKLTARN